MRASSYNDVSGLQTESTSDENGGYDLGFANNGSYAVYKNIQFNMDITQVQGRVANGGTEGGNGTIEFHLDKPDGQLVGIIVVPQTGGWQNRQSVTSAATGATGIHDLYAVFKGSGSIGNLNWFQFK